MFMSDCVFCKIIAGELPADVSFEDDKVVVFASIDPKAKTHLLIVPRKHIRTIAEMEEGDEILVGHMVKIGKEVAAKLGLKGYKLNFNVGEGGGQEVFHIHLHLLS
ncbi:histidine triad nucleotide-binding protein [Candidatus Gracilibacteria bacterium]|nr:histidine triad nucleotide-binding protein [Candidatus Gracilibacteria bacterium]